MAKATYVKEITGPTGKKKYQANVWHKGLFYASKVFDSKSLAVAFKETEELKAVKGGPTAAQRAQVREENECLARPMGHWADLYVTAHADEHGATRLADYRLVGHLVADTPLIAFSGRAGARLIVSLGKAWYTDRRPRTTKPRAEGSPAQKPLKHITVRHRLTALMRLIGFAKSELDDAAEKSGKALVKFTMPVLKELFKDYKLPPAHADPRHRQATDEECRRLLAHFGAKSDMGEFVQMVDETGARLGEIRLATGSNVDIFTVGGQVVGGCLTLLKHKTFAKVGIRHIPLSMYAAQILDRRKASFGQECLFPGLPSKDFVCKTFDAACALMEFDEKLLIKDFRRSFINRNKAHAPKMDLVHIVGNSSMLPEALTQREKATSAAVGHVDDKMTATYSVPDMEENARIFTRTSRNPLIRSRPGVADSSELEAAKENFARLQAQLSDALSQIARLQVRDVS